MEQMGILPFYSVLYKGKELQRKDYETCSFQGGDCFNFATKYLKFQFWVLDCPNENDKCNKTYYDA